MGNQTAERPAFAQDYRKDGTALKRDSIPGILLFRDLRR